MRLICIGKTNKDYLIKGEAEYIKRIRRYVKFEMLSLNDVKKKFSSNTELMKAEAALFLAKIKDQDFVIGLDEKGKTFGSVHFAEFVNKRMSHSSGDIVFVIGGAYGFDETLRKRFNKTLSLSNLTFSHQMVRMIFLEQLYRCFTILHNEPYHHEG